MACSSSESPSRKLPSAARASTATAPGSIFRFSAFAMRSISPGNFLERERAKLKKLRARLDRLDQIFGARRGQDENDALGRLFERFQQRVRGFVGELVRFVEDHDFVAARRRARSAPSRAARESGRCRGWKRRQFRARRAKCPAEISRQESQVLSGSGVGPFAQFSAFARMRAVVVLPTPRTPEKI